MVGQGLARLSEQNEGVGNDRVVACRLEEEHESQGGEERSVDSGVKVLSPGLGEAHVKHTQVGLNFFEELDRVIAPSQSDQGLLGLLESCLAGEVEGRLGEGLKKLVHFPPFLY